MGSKSWYGQPVVLRLSLTVYRKGVRRCYLLDQEAVSIKRGNTCKQLIILKAQKMDEAKHWRGASQAH